MSSDELQSTAGAAANCATLRVEEATPLSLPQSIGFGLSPIPPKPLRGLGDKAGDPLGRKSTTHSSSAPPHAPLMRRPRRGRRFYESRYSLSPQSPANGSAQSTAQIQAPYSAQRGAKTVPGFRTRRTVAAQSTAASLRLRSRSAGAARHPKDGRATEFSHTVEFFRAPARFILFRLTPK